MYYLISESGVYPAKNRQDLNKKLGILLEEEEFHTVGADKVVKIAGDDIDFLKDKKRMSNIFFGNFFKKDNRTFLLVLVCNIIGFVNLFTLLNIMKLLQGG